MLKVPIKAINDKKLRVASTAPKPKKYTSLCFHFSCIIFAEKTPAQNIIVIGFDGSEK